MTPPRAARRPRPAWLAAALLAAGAGAVALAFWLGANRAGGPSPTPSGSPGGATGAPAVAQTAPAGTEAGPPAQPPVATHGFQVIAEYPHDPDAFTQGLVYHDGDFFEGTGLYGHSSLRHVDLETGQVLRQIDLESRYFGEGITLWNGTLIQITWKEQQGFLYDSDTFAKTGEFTYATEGWGITHDDTRLFMSDGTSTITLLDPETLQPTGTLDVHDGSQPVRSLNELEFVGDEIYANLWLTDRIAVIDPATGAVTAYIDLTGLLDPADRGPETDVLNGIAYDPVANRLFVTGKKWPTVFEIELVPPRIVQLLAHLPFLANWPAPAP